MAITVFEVPRRHIKCNSLTILIVTVTLSAGQSGYVNLIVTSFCDTFDCETVGQNCCYLCTSPQETKNTVYEKSMYLYPLPPASPPYMDTQG